MQLSINYTYAAEEIAAVSELQNTLMGTLAVLSGEPIPPAVEYNNLFVDDVQVTMGNTMGGTTTTTICRNEDSLILKIDIDASVAKVQALLSALNDIAFWGRTFPVHALKELKELSSPTL